MQISKRLQRVSEYIDDNTKVIDVGCDHALLDIYLEKTKKNITIVASDIKEGPLAQAKKNIEKYHSTKIKLSLSDGLDNLDKKINTIIISGLGGDTIIDILTKNLDNLSNIKTIVLSPNNNLFKVRKSITKIGYIIDQESYITDSNKTYPVIKFIKGKKKYSKKDLFFGPIARITKDKDYKTYFTHMLQKEKIALSKLPKKYFWKRFKLQNKVKQISQEL